MIEFDLIHLDPVTRAHMLAELDSDLKTGPLAYSLDFNDRGRGQYPTVMRGALTDGHIHTLAVAPVPAFFDPTRTDKNGKVTRLGVN